MYKVELDSGEVVAVEAATGVVLWIGFPRQGPGTVPLGMDNGKRYILHTSDPMRALYARKVKGGAQ